jgi:ankyrin repeat protein
VTPLHTAAREGNAESVRSLLREGADAHALDDLGRTALYYAASKRSAETVLALLAWGCDPNVADEGGVTPLMAAIGSHVGFSLTLWGGPGDYLFDTPEEEVETIKAILLGRPNVDHKDCGGHAAIHYAGIKLNWEAFELLVSAGCNVTLRDEDDMDAAQLGRMGIEDYDEGTKKVNKMMAAAIERARSLEG